MEVVIKTNKLLVKVQKFSQLITIPSHDGAAELQIVCWTDASWANRADKSSTGGFFIGLAPTAIRSGQSSFVAPFFWATQKLRRQARSSLSAEVQALANAEQEQELYFARLAWAEPVSYTHLTLPTKRIV